jgi:parvulin-like peptidyl-prolyl isomerase
MIKHIQYRHVTALLLSLALSSTSWISHAVATQAMAAADERSAPQADLIARVGDQAITFNQINTMLNSTAVVGVSVPALGTRERDTARIVVLDKVISANLLYLDAVRLGLDKDPAYQRAMQSFTDGMLGNRYYRRVVAGDIPVSAEEVKAHFEKTAKPDAVLTDEIYTLIEATLRKRKLEERMAIARAELREGTSVEVYPDKLAPADVQQADTVVVAKYGDQFVTWGEVKTTLLAASKGATELDPLAMEVDAQLAALQALIDQRIIASKARQAGMENDPIYRARYQEFSKTKLINMHRARLARQMEPTEAQLKAYYDANRGRIMQVEKRKLQEVLLETRAQADALKQRLEAGELTMYQAAAEYSIAPAARQHLGEVGWVAAGRAQPALDAVIFELELDEIGGPVESTEGWHLVKVLDVADAVFEDFKDPETRRQSRRRYIHDQLDRYVTDLRKNEFKVEVLEHNLHRLAQQEADMVRQLANKAAQPGSITEKRLEEMQKVMTR